MEWTDVPPSRPGGYRRQEAEGFAVSPIKTGDGWMFALSRRNPARIGGRDWLGAFPNAKSAKQRAEELR
jgi:hypothetical protein